MGWLYSFSIWAYYFAIRTAALFNPKARLWLSGRANQWQTLKENQHRFEGSIWMHCASLGEFEQGRSVLEGIRQKQPDARILVTFFSPSGYTIRKDYDKADFVCYLPMDTRGQVKRFLDLVKPSQALFVKYEFWFNFLQELEKRQVPTYLISGIFRPQQHFFKWYGGWFRKRLSSFSHFFVQQEASAKLLRKIGQHNVSVSGDTRFDRVATLAEQNTSLPMIEAFANGETVVIGGSTWPEDEKLLLQHINQSNHTYKLILAPHEVGRARIDKLIDSIKVPTLRYSEATLENISSARVLVIDNIGMLSALYRQANIAMIGGGFGRGIHNTLEAATFGLPILIGPNYQKFQEAVELVTKGGCKVVNRQEQLNKHLDLWLESKEEREIAGDLCRKYVINRAGATEMILQKILAD